METLATKNDFFLLFAGSAKSELRAGRILSSLPDRVVPKLVSNPRVIRTRLQSLSSEKTSPSRPCRLTLVLPSFSLGTVTKEFSASTFRNGFPVPTYKLHRNANPEEALDYHELGYSGMISLDQTNHSLYHSLSSVVEAVEEQTLENLPFYL